MSAAVLREAAALMRSRAEAATPPDPRLSAYDPYALGSEGYAVLGAPREGRVARTFVARCGMNDWDTDKRNAEHIASWHPAVALAVADWLDDALDAHLHVRSGNYPSFLKAVEVARAYLGDDCDAAGVDS